MKTAGQIAYEAELQARPHYHDGGARPAWAQLRPIAKTSWEKNPTARWAMPAEWEAV